MTRLMSHWTSAMSPAMSRVTAPIPAARSWTDGASAKIGFSRTSMYTPAVTIVAAWISALTGVGPLHRVREPGVERHLRRLGDGAAQEAERDQVQSPVAAGLADLIEDRPVLEGADPLDQQEQRQRHRRVAERVHDERLLGRGDRGGAVLVVPDQEVRAEPDETPAGEQEQEVARLDEQQHREDEERHVREEATLLVRAVHVPDRVGDDQEPDAGDDQHHERRDRVEEDGEADLEVARGQPGPERGRMRPLLRRILDEPGDRRQRRNERDEDGKGRDVARRLPRNPRPEQRDQHGGRERREQADPGGGQLSP